LHRAHAGSALAGVADHHLAHLVLVHEEHPDPFEQIDEVLARRRVGLAALGVRGGHPSLVRERLARRGGGSQLSFSEGLDSLSSGGRPPWTNTSERVRSALKMASCSAFGFAMPSVEKWGAFTPA